MADRAETSSAAERAPTSLRAFNRAVYLIPLGALSGLIVMAKLMGQINFANVRYYGFMDQYRYVAMAQHPFGSEELAREAPFCWRLLAPLIVHILPFSTLAGFWLLTVLSLGGATLALMWFLRGLGLARGSVVAAGVAFVGLTYATGFTLWDYLLVDPLAMALLALALASAVHRHGILLVLTLVVLATAKETVLLAGLFAVVWAWEHRDTRMLRWASAGLAAGALVLGIIHLTITAATPYNLITEFRLWSGIHHNPPAYFLNRAFDALVDAWGVFLPLAALQVLHAPRVWRSPAFVLTLVVAYAQILIASDTQRLVIYAFPLVIAAGAFEIEYLAKRFKIARWWFWSPTIVIELIWWIGTYGTWYRSVDSPLTIAVTALTYWFIPITAAAFAIALATLRRSRRLVMVD